MRYLVLWLIILKKAIKKERLILLEGKQVEKGRSFCFNPLDLKKQTPLSINNTNLSHSACLYYDWDYTTFHQLQDYLGNCNTIIVTQESEGTRLGFTTHFELTVNIGFTDEDGFGIANENGVIGELGSQAHHGNNAFVMSDVDGIVKMWFDAVDLAGTTNPIFSLRGWINSTSWELQDSIRISMIMTGCAGATTVDLLNTTGQDIDGNYTEETWNLYNLDLVPYIGCMAELEIMFSSNQSSEFFAIDSILFTEGSIPTALPVDLVDFNAELMDAQEVALNWQTASEENNEGFEIERSYDGRNWEMIDFIYGKGTTNELNEYSYIDKKPNDDTNYYRLRQVDFDGAFEYSDVKIVKMGSDAKAFDLFPNPVKNGKVNINFPDGINGSSTLRIYSLQGQLLKQTTLTEDSNQIDLSAYITGMYLLEVNNGQTFWQDRVIVQ